MNFLKQGNEAYKKKDYELAATLYTKAAIHLPELKKFLQFNLVLLEKKLNNNSELHKFQTTMKFDNTNTKTDLIGNKSKLKYSVIMPTWNRRNIIDKAIKSVINQKYKDWELIIVDDHSIDSTLEYLEVNYMKFIKNKKIKLFLNPKKGVSSARNYGLSKITGDIVTYLDSDNMWDKEYLEEINKKYSMSSTIETIYTAVNVINKDNEETFIRDVTYNRKNILNQNFIDLNIFSHRRFLLSKYGQFNTVMSRLVDYEMIIRFTRTKEPFYINKPLATYIFDSNNNQISNFENYEFNSKIFKELNKIELKVHGLQTKDSYLDIEQKIKINTNKNQQIKWIKNNIRVKNRISIIIPAFNNIDYTKKCITSILEKTTYNNYEIVVVDNYSVDVTPDWFFDNKHNLPVHVKYVRNDFNYGYSVGNNIGFINSTGEYVLLLNNDIEIITPNWLELFLESLNEENISIVGPKLLFDDNTVQCAGIAFNNINCMPYHIFQGLKSTDSLVCKSRVLQATTGACLFMKASTFSSVKGFSPKYLNGAEDIDLCLKINKMFGTKVKYDHRIEILHYESKSVGRSIAIEYNRKILQKEWLQPLQPRDDIMIYADDGLIINEYKRNTNDKDMSTAMYLPLFHTLPFKNENINSIIIFKPSGIGNMIMFTPALIALKQMFKNASFTMACFSADAGIVKDYVDDVLILKKNKRTGAFDKHDLEDIIIKDTYQLAIYPQFTSIGKPTEYLKKAIPYHIFTKNIDYENRHEVLHNMDVAYMLGWKKQIPDMLIPVDENYILNNRVVDGIIVHVGASDTVHMQKKKWPSENWIKLFQKLPENYPIVFVGGANETQDIDIIVGQLNRQEIIRYDGKLNLAQTASVIKKGQMMISTDSGLMHMAAALKKPLVAIFGPTLLSKNSAWGEDYNKHHISSKVECAPCYADPKKLFECPDPICMKDIMVEEVVERILKTLKEI